MSAEVSRHADADADIAVGGTSVSAILRRRAERQPDWLGYAFLSEAGHREDAMTYAELDRRARAIAVALRAAGAADGQRALLLFAPGLDFVAAFFGCLYAGTIAVPAYPPDPFRLDRTLPRLSAIVDDATPVVALTTTLMLGYTDEIAARASELAALRWIAVDEIDDDAAQGWTAPGAAGAEPALLQYTSGSTGAPKGVVLTHANLLHNLDLIGRVFHTTTKSRGLIWLPPYHDMGLIGGLLQPLHGGFPVRLMSPLDFLANPMSWLEAVGRTGATVTGGPNFAYDLCVRKSTPEQRAALDLRSWEVAFNGAEPIRPATMTRFAEAFASAGFRADAFLPCYGLAEATLMVSGGALTSNAGPSTAGDVDHEALQRGDVVADPASVRPLSTCGAGATDQRIVIVDPPTHRLCLPGRVGEVWVSGPSVAQGYWGRPDESRDVFEARIAGSGEGPFLRTGDLGYLRAGELVITGRIKDLLILRGRNHYPQDIELTAQEADPALRVGCTAAFLLDRSADDDGEDHLAVVQEVVRGAEDVDVDAVARRIRHAVAQEHDVRVGTIALLAAGAIPKTSSGKVRRRACKAQLLAGDLTEIGRSSGGRGVGSGRPACDVVLDRETVLAARPAERRGLVVGYLRNRTALACGIAVGAVVPDEPLVAAGLDSLAAQELGQAVDTDLGVRLPLGDVLAGATLSAVAAGLVERMESAPATADLRPMVVPTSAVRSAPLSHGQRSLWFLQQLSPRSSAYTTVAALRVRGGLDRAALRSAFDSVVERHAMLRTTFTIRDGEPFQVVHDRPLQDGYLDVDIAGMTDVEVSERLGDDAHEPFDLVTGPLVRLRRYRLADDEHLVLLTAHHIVTDFWSLRILSRELEALYAENTGGTPADLPAAGATFHDLVAWQGRLLDSPAKAELEQYWKSRLRGAVPTLRLPRRPVADTTDRSELRSFRLGRELTRRLRQRAAAEGATLYMVLLTAFQTLLHRYTGQDDLSVGTPLAARGRREFDQVVGYFMNPVVIRSRLTGNAAFQDLLDQTRAQVAGAVEHQDYPAALVAERHSVAHDTRGPYRAMFVFNQPTRAEEAGLGTAMLGFPGVRRPFGSSWAESIEVPHRESAHDLELAMSEIDGDIRGTVLFRLDLLDAAAADLLVDRLAAVLDAIAADPRQRLGSLPRCGAAERTRALETWNTTSRELEGASCVPQQFEDQVRRTPDAVAVVSGAEEWTYRELNERSNRFAHFLQAAGVAPGHRVGLCVERSVDLVVAILAVLKAGAAYVPLDPATPRERVAATFADAAVDVVVSRQSLAGKIPSSATRVVLMDTEWRAIARCPSTNPRPAAGPQDCAYVVYTSGSTGTPKGVEVRHGGLGNYIRHFVRHCGVTSGDRVLQFSSPGFDASAEEIYSALTSGATLVLRTDSMLADPAQFLDTCAAQGVTVLCVATSFWHELMVGVRRRTATVPPAVRLTVIGGEKALPEHVATWHEHVDARVRLLNTYGPTEATIVTTSADLTRADAAGDVPIGTPVANVRTYLLGGDLEPVPPGVLGELYIGGAGVAQGYRNKPGPTSERFVADPFRAGKRLYRTGDHARHLPDGRLTFVGRADRQVKVSGYRLEPGEIESALRRVPGVADAVVVVRTERGQLAAYVIPSGEAAPLDHELRTALRASLPEYMVPVWYVSVAAFPRTAQGKLDLAALPAPSGPTDDELSAEPPHTADEQRLAEIWADVLGVPVIRRHDDFFALGGHSLLATKVLARISDTLGRELPLWALFDAPTLAMLAARLADAAPSGSAPISPAPRDQLLPLSYVQEQIWFLEQFDPGAANYNVPRALRVAGPLDPATVTAVFDELEVRHEILRTTFPDIDGVPVQVVHPPRGIHVTHLHRRDLGGDLPGDPSRAEVDGAVRDLIVALGREPFDLAEGPLLRVTLLRLEPDVHVLIVIEHHLLHDGWAQGVFLRDFLELFQARATGGQAELPDLPIQYADFVVWQRTSLRGRRMRELLEYWTAKLAGAPRMLQLPTDRPRAEVRTARGDEERLAIDADLAQRLGTCGRRHGASPFMTMFAAFSTLMSGYTGQRDLLIGTGIANRQRPELENLLGMMINTVVLRADLSGEPSFLTLLDRTRETCLQAYAHQDLPFSKLVERLRPSRDTSHMPVIQVMFSFLNTPLPPLQLPGLQFEVIEVHNRTAKFDMNIVVMVPPEYRGTTGTNSPVASGEGITVLAEYNTDLFDAATIREMLQRYGRLLEAAVASPERAVADLVRELGLDTAPAAGLTA